MDKSSNISVGDTVTGVNNGYDYVDLGLSIKWATFNVGATKPEECGDHFAWGETESKTDYGMSTYKWCNGLYHPTLLTKYCNKRNNGNNGFTDSKTTLDPEDDVAHIKWGGTWRMPTRAEQDELIDKCAWELYDYGNTEFNGVAGCKVTSNIEGYKDRFIFLPAFGYREGTLIRRVFSFGCYWSSSLYTDHPIEAWCIDFFSDEVREVRGFRDNGFSVRPVCQ